MFSPERRRVVVIGVGAVTPLGNTAQETVENLYQGKRGYSALPFDPERGGNVSLIDLLTEKDKKNNLLYEPSVYCGPVKLAGQIFDFKPEEVFRDLPLYKYDRSSKSIQLVVKASWEALRQAGLLDENNQIINVIDRDRIGVMIGTGFGGFLELLKLKAKCERGINFIPEDLLRLEPERSSTAVAMAFNKKRGERGLGGPNFTPTAACSTSNIAILEACMAIGMGEADFMIGGGTAAPLHPVILNMFDCMTVLSHAENPEDVKSPYDEGREGFVMSEGVAVFFTCRKKSRRSCRSSDIRGNYRYFPECRCLVRYYSE